MADLTTHAGATQVRAMFLRAVALHQAGDLRGAHNGYEQVLAMLPSHADALHLLGVVAAQSNDPVRAVHLINRAIAYDPLNAAAYCNLGSSLNVLGRYDEALAAYDSAIALKSDYTEAHFYRGNVLYGLKRLDAALLSYNAAIAVQPNLATAHSNRGNILREMRRYEEALASYERAVAIDPGFAQAHFNRGVALNELKEPLAALASYDRAIAIDPDLAEAHFNKSLVMLLVGDFAGGWIEHEWRWKNKFGSNFHERRDLREPLWLGVPSLAGAVILLHGEQGYGDTLQFCRYATLVAELGATVVLEVPRPLARLLAELQGVSQVIARGDPLPRADYQCPVMSLPLAFKTELDNIPAPGKYLSSDPARVARWEERLGPRSAPRVGLMWNGNPRQPNDRNRSVQLADLLPHLPQGYHYVSLQREVREADRTILNANQHIADHAGDLHDFSDTAALCECLDVVVSVCTSVAHLSGALGKKTWILLSFAADWRWLLDRNDSPWYPSVTLFRQEKLGDWAGVFDRVRRELTRAFPLSQQPR